MRRLSRMATVLVLCMAVILSLGIYAAAGGLSGAQYFGMRYEEDQVLLTPGLTIDYEFGLGFHITLDVQSRYDWKKEFSDIETRYDISANWYTDWWIFEGYCISVGGVYARDRPTWYLEFARPFD